MLLSEDVFSEALFMAAGDKDRAQPYSWEVAVLCLQMWTRQTYLSWLHLFCREEVWGWGIYFRAEFLLQASPFNNNQRLKQLKEMNIENTQEENVYEIPRAFILGLLHVSGSACTSCPTLHSPALILPLVANTSY